jgi:hypothetical protein
MLPGEVPPRLRKHKIPEVLPPAPNLSPSASIPVAPLGYSPPGPTYLGRNNTLISLDFLDDNRLLFTFRAPGLIQRDASDLAMDRARQMKAVVLTLPDGKVQAQALWIIPDRRHYLWMLGDGRFLVHERDGLSIGNDKLETKPFLDLPGELERVEIDPEQKALIAEFAEKTGDAGTDRTGPVPASTTSTGIRVVALPSGRVLISGHAPAVTTSSINGEGSLELVHDKLDQWSLKIDAFAGGSRVVAHVESTCVPTARFISEEKVLVAGCDRAHTPKLDGVSVKGQQLWELEVPEPYLEPLLVTALNGSRFARETIVLKNGRKPSPETLWMKVVKGQALRVYDSASGKVEMETSLNPTLDAGGNAAFSPSGRRFAVLSGKTIQIFDLSSAKP